MAKAMAKLARLIKAAQFTRVPPPWLKGGIEGGGASSEGAGTVADVSVVGGPVVVEAGAAVVVVDAPAPDGRVVVGAGLVLAGALVATGGAVVGAGGAVVGGEVVRVVVVVGSTGRIWAPAPGPRRATADARVAATRTRRRT